MQISYQYITICIPWRHLSKEISPSGCAYATKRKTYLEIRVFLTSEFTSHLLAERIRKILNWESLLWDFLVMITLLLVLSIFTL